VTLPGATEAESRRCTVDRLRPPVLGVCAPTELLPGPVAVDSGVVRRLDPLPMCCRLLVAREGGGCASLEKLRLT
jgi:hypothetical protein